MKTWAALVVAFELSLTGTALAGEAVGDGRVTKANFELAARWSVPRQISLIQDPWATPLWVPGRNQLFYKRREAGMTRFFYLDLDRGEKRDLTLNPSLLQLLAAVPPEAPKTGFSGFRIADDGDGVVFDLNGLACRYTVSSNLFSRLEPEQDGETNGGAGVVSPDARYEVVVRDRDLILVDVNGQLPETPLTVNGEEGLELSEPVAVWSPDSRYVAFIVQDWRTVEDLWLINHYADPRPTLETFKWPMPGESIETFSLWVYDVEKKVLKRVTADLWQEQTLAEPRWAPDSATLYFTRMSRDWMSLDLCAADPSSGSSRVVVEERNHRQIITRLPYHVLQSTGEILWWSMGQGWGHYSLYDGHGRLIHRVTSGDYHSGRVVHVDEEERVLYFMGNAREPGRNPYLHHLYRTDLDGSHLRLLTPADAEHDVTMADTGDFLLDNFSRADTAPRAEVRDSAGTLVMDLGPADVSPLTDAGWRPPEIFSAKAADGITDLWGVMFKPFDLDPAKKYPVVTYGYPGKETESLPFRFCHNGWVSMVSNALAQYGFIVVVSGNRGGSPERSYEYYNFGEDDLRDYPVADKKAVVEQLAQRYPFIDLDRVGIMGQSSGGFMAATAILLEPEFFKVAVAKAGNYDNNLYYHHWNERYGRVTERVVDGRRRFESTSESANQLAANLAGRLLIVQGDMDRHVPPSLAFRLAHDLMMANKRFDMFVVPNGDHFWGDNMPYLMRYTELDFVEHLMGDSRWSADVFQPGGDSDGGGG